MAAAGLDKSFDRVAELYERVRPSYPQCVFERMLDFSGVKAQARLLEVGTGTGKATLPLAQRGFHILGLEPGEQLAQIARARLAQFPNVEIETVSFEDWVAPAGGFDLAFIAQAFHWLTRDQRLTKLALALFGWIVELIGEIRGGRLRAELTRLASDGPHEHAPGTTR